MDQNQSIPLLQPQALLLGLLETLPLSTSSSNFCLLCNSSRTIRISNYKESNWNLSVCQLFNLEISDQLKQSLHNASFCGKCLQLVLDIDFVMVGIKAYEQKLLCLKQQTEQLLYATLVTNEARDPSNSQYLDKDPSESEAEDQNSIFTNSIEENDYPNVKPILKSTLTGKSKLKYNVIVSKKKKKSEPPQVQPTFTRSGRRISKPKEYQSDLNVESNYYDDESSVQRSSGHSDSNEEDSDSEIPKKKSRVGSSHPGNDFNQNSDTKTKREAKFHCLICNKSYSMKRCLYRHYITHYRELENYIEIPQDILDFVKNYRSRSPSASSFDGESETETESQSKPNKSRRKKNPNKCTQCSRKFSKSWSLEKHMLKDHLKAQPKVKCFLCEKRVYVEEYLKDHYLSHHTELDLAECQEKLPSEIIQLVMKTKSKKYLDKPIAKRKPFACDQCSLRYNKPDQLEAHIQRDHLKIDPKVPCLLCPKLFYTQNYVNDHYIRIHGEKDIGDIKLPPEILELVMKESYRKTLSCLICNKSVYRESSLKTHYATQHTIIEIENSNEAIPRGILEYVKNQSTNKTGSQSSEGESETGAESESQSGRSKDGKIKAKKVRLPCLLCDKAFFAQQRLNLHYKHEHLDTDLVGDIEIPSEVLELVRQPTNIRKPRIPKPPKVRSKKYNVKSKPSISSYPCKDCGKIFPKATARWSHNRAMHTGDLDKPTCSVCGKMFKTPEEVTEHEEIHKSFTSTNSSNPWTCVLCPLDTIGPFQSKRVLQKHVLGTHETDDNVFRCAHCPRTVLTRERLRQHERAAHGPKVHICDICGFQASAPFRLREHQRLKHTEDKPFKCDVEGCSKAFKLKLLLKRHKTGVHGPVNDKYTCTICSKKFVSQQALEFHSVYHLNIRPFVCEICSAAFKTMRNLYTHFKVHEKNDSGYTFKPRRARLPEGQFMPDQFPDAPKASKFS